MSLRVVSLRRYPVKSMGGESLAVAHVVTRGISGDRIFAVRDADDKLLSGKNTKRMARNDGIFAFEARTEGRRVVIADASGRIGDAGNPAVDAALTEALGTQVRVAHETDVPHFDDGAVSLVGTATLEWCARELGVDADPRRLRVNIVVETTEPFEEEGWIGSTIKIGGVLLNPMGRLLRCRTVDLAQDGVEGTTQWLVPLGQRRDARLAVYCDVASRGAVAVGDEVTLQPAGDQ
ncbi:MOSC domain-containing protein [Demequina sp. TTPB684]|uniref:MOSC domain-containing protein n=1 Tax=unclassified Demequina TaxID=2620311 RepID=UPI001CF1F7F5|nr:MULTISPECIES: MOSC domain-containing protein [unclassified Demequina]MCB2413426.1 MOSC domain-containing protein [Demequina sp. TTPB684]UPU87989.1 MOSC domain-containing protein [Demequina sp. TMPB413]